MIASIFVEGHLCYGDLICLIVLAEMHTPEGFPRTL